MIIAGKDGNLSDLTSEPIYARDADIGGKIGSVFILQDGYVRRVYPDDPTLSIWYDDKSTDNAAIMHMSHARKNNSWCPGYTYSTQPQDLVWATWGSEMDYNPNYPTLCAGKYWVIYSRTTSAVIDEVIDFGDWPTEDSANKDYGSDMPCALLFARTRIPSTDYIQNMKYLKNLPSLYGFFAECKQLVYASFDDLDTSNVRSTREMFQSCSNLKSVDLKGLDTSHVVDMSYMFAFSGISSVDVSGFNTANVRNMAHMFDDCNNLSSLEVNFTNTDNLENVSYMFRIFSGKSLIVHMPKCPKLTDASGMMNGVKVSSIDLSDIDLSNVSDMSHFATGAYLKTIAFEDSSRSPNSVTKMNGAFANCHELRSADLSGIDGSNLESMDYLFATGYNAYDEHLVEIVTPKNIPSTCSMMYCLPYDGVNDSFVWVGSDGNTYTHGMPVGNAEPITLTRTPVSEV